MAYRIIQWSSGNVGKHALKTVATRDELDLQPKVFFCRAFQFRGLSNRRSQHLKRRAGAMNRRCFRRPCHQSSAPRMRSIKADRSARAFKAVGMSTSTNFTGVCG